MPAWNVHLLYHITMPRIPLARAAVKQNRWLPARAPAQLARDQIRSIVATVEWMRSGPRGPLILVAIMSMDTDRPAGSPPHDLPRGPVLKLIEAKMTIPKYTAEDLKKLPLRAIVAFATRCARRV